MFRIDEALKDFAPYVVYGVVSAFRAEDNAPTIHVNILTTQNAHAAIRAQIRQAIERAMDYRTRRSILVAFGLSDGKFIALPEDEPTRLLLAVRKAKADEL